jgi:hypothetical protein
MKKINYFNSLLGFPEFAQSFAEEEANNNKEHDGLRYQSEPRLVQLRSIDLLSHAWFLDVIQLRKIILAIDLVIYFISNYQFAAGAGCSISSGAGGWLGILFVFAGPATYCHNGCLVLVNKSTAHLKININFYDVSLFDGINS